MNLFAGKEDADLENGLVDTTGKGEGRTNLESNVDIGHCHV